MKKKISIVLLVLFMAIILLAGDPMQQGEASYYPISSARDFEALRSAGELNNVKIELLNDITLNNWNQSINSMTGVLEGNGYTITINGTAALFDSIYDGRVQNLGLAGSVTFNDLSSVGAVANTVEITCFDKVFSFMNLRNEGIGAMGTLVGYYYENSESRPSSTNYGMQYCSFTGRVSDLYTWASEMGDPIKNPFIAVDDTNGKYDRLNYALYSNDSLNHTREVLLSYPAGDVSTNTIQMLMSEDTDNWYSNNPKRLPRQITGGITSDAAVVASGFFNYFDDGSIKTLTLYTYNGAGIWYFDGTPASNAFSGYVGEVKFSIGKYSRNICLNKNVDIVRFEDGAKEAEGAPNYYEVNLIYGELLDNKTIFRAPEGTGWSYQYKISTEVNNEQLPDGIQLSKYGTLVGAVTTIPAKSISVKLEEMDMVTGDWHDCYLGINISPSEMKAENFKKLFGNDVSVLLQDAEYTGGSLAITWNNGVLTEDDFEVNYSDADKLSYYDNVEGVSHTAMIIITGKGARCLPVDPIASSFWVAVGDKPVSLGTEKTYHLMQRASGWKLSGESNDITYYGGAFAVSETGTYDFVPVKVRK